MGTGQDRGDRLAVQRQYKASALRREPRASEAPVERNELHVFIICAGERESKRGMFSETRARFVDCGVHPTCIHRMHGVNPGKPPRGFTDTDMRKSNFLTKYFLEHFAPLAASKLSETNVAAVCWAEDDCHLKNGTTAAQLVAEIKAAAPAAAWLGFVKLAGKPRYGAHVLLGPLQIHRQLAL